MPVLSNTEHQRLSRELNARVTNLLESFESRGLKCRSEGLRRGSWMNPDSMCATKASKSELGLAVEDFKSILAQIKALK